MRTILDEALEGSFADNLGGSFADDLYDFLLNPTDYISETEAAALFGCSIDTLRGFAALGVLTPRTGLTGNTWYSRKEIINKFATNGGSHEKADGNCGMQTGSR